jgi:hypothetical protein
MDDEPDPFAAAAARRRAAGGQQIGDDATALDPDWEEVPPEVAGRERVRVVGWDSDADDIVRGDSDVLVIVPSFFARRVGEGFFDADQGAA